MKRPALLAALFAMLLLGAGAACSDDDGTTPPAELDSAIAVAESHDAAALRDLLEFVPMACTTELGAGGPPKCAAGEADGTEVEVFPFSTCEPEWLRDGEMLDAALKETVAIMPALRAAFETPDGAYRGDGDYAALFAGPDPRLDGAADRGVIVVVGDGGSVVEIQLGCGAGEDPDGMIPSGVDDFLIDLR
jgi:hypothetical protein